MKDPGDPGAASPLADAGAEGSGSPPRRGRARAKVGHPVTSLREMLGIAYRDPEHLAERLTLHAARILGPPSAEWAVAIRRVRPDVSRAQLAEELRVQSARLARIQGLIAGTPFLIALVPAYLMYLWEEARMTLRTSALYGRDPTSLQTAAEALVLRGVHPDVEAATAALVAVRDTPLPERLAERRPLRTWIRAVYQLLVFGAFLEPRSGPDPNRGRIRMVLGAAIAGVIWAMTWVLPVTFMIVMAWGCETHTRALGRTALSFYDGEAASAEAARTVAALRRDRGHSLRALSRSALIMLSVAIPIVFVAYVDHQRNQVGINWLGALGALVALAVVIAAATTLRAHERRMLNS